MHAYFPQYNSCFTQSVLWVLASVKLKRDRTHNPYARADTRDADTGSRKRTAEAASRLTSGDSLNT